MIRKTPPVQALVEWQAARLQAQIDRIDKLLAKMGPDNETRGTDTTTIRKPDR